MKPAPKQSKVNFINSLVRFPSARRGLGRCVMMDPPTTASLDMRNNWFLAKQKKTGGPFVRKCFQPYLYANCRDLEAQHLPRCAGEASFGKECDLMGFPPLYCWLAVRAETFGNWFNLLDVVCVRNKLITDYASRCQVDGFWITATRVFTDHTRFKMLKDCHSQLVIVLKIPSVWINRTAHRTHNPEVIGPASLCRSFKHSRSLSSEVLEDKRKILVTGTDWLRTDTYRYSFQTYNF